MKNNHDLIKELIKSEMSDGKNIGEAMESIVGMLELKEKAIVFFGFQGELAYKFIAIAKEDSDEVKTRLYAIDDSISPSFHGIAEFYEFHEKYNTKEKPLVGINIDEAYSILRSNYKAKPQEEYVEPEDVDDFDDNCNDTCIPGNHTCGKKN